MLKPYMSEEMMPEKDIEESQGQGQTWQVVIFMVNGKANHAGLSISDVGFADLSLLGSRVIPWTHPQLPKGERLFYDIVIHQPKKAHEWLKRPGLLSPSILAQERSCRGWYLTWDASDFVRTLRDRRSRDPSDMNCVESIVYALEIGGRKVPTYVMTPSELLSWCEAGFPESDER
jgi:hypothetical protein